MSSRLLVAGAWLAALLAGGAWLAIDGSVRSDLSSFMPRGATPQERLLLTELRSGPASRVIVASVSITPGEAPGKRSDEIASALRQSGLFSQVANGRPPLGAHERERLLAYRYLLSPTVTAERFSAGGLARALRERLHELKSAAPLLDRGLLARDPTAELRSVLDSWRPPVAVRRRDGVWTTEDGAAVLLLAQTVAPGFALDAQARAVQAIRQAAAGTEHGLERVPSVAVSGPGPFAVATREVIRSESRRLAIAASAALMVLLLVGYRSPRLALLAGLPLGCAMLVGALAVNLLFGDIHGITIAFGATVLGVVVDYPIHVFSHLRGGLEVGPRLARLWPTVRLSALTTAAGYLALCVASFPGLQELALFAIAGLLAAAACTRWALPAFLPPLWPRPSSSRGAGLLVSCYLGARRARPAARLVALALALAATAVLVHRPPTWEDDIGALSPIPAAVLAADGALRKRLGIPEVSHVAVIRADNVQSALEASEEVAAALGPLVDEGVVTGIDFAARYLPSVATQRRRQRALPAPATLAANLRAALRGLPFRADAFAPFLSDVAAARELSPLTPAALAGTALEPKVGSLLFVRDGTWYALVGFSGVRAPEALEQRLESLGRADLHYVNLKRDMSRLLGRFRTQGLRSALLGITLIAALLWVGLRSARRAIVTLLPGAAAILVTFAALELLGEHLTLFHLVSTLLVLGLGVDYGLFFGRTDDDAETRGRTFHGLAVCVTSTVGVFALLATSEVPVLHAIGVTVAIGASASFLAAMALCLPTGAGETPTPTRSDLVG